MHPAVVPAAHAPVSRQVRIPRINMAARYARVERDGTYVKVTQVAGADKVLTNMLVYVRVDPAIDCGSDPCC